MRALDPVLLVVGLAALVLGGELLVRGASRLARSFGLPSLVVGLTVVSFATSAPELTVTLNASLSGAAGLAIGNVIGSNIANILLVLGTAAVISPLLVTKGVVKRDVPVMISITVLLFVLALDGTISLVDGAVMLLIVVSYVSIAVVHGRRDEAAGSAAVAAEHGSGDVHRGGPDHQAPRHVDEPALLASTHPDLNEAPTSPARNLLLIAGGVALLVAGAQALVSAATSIATSLGVSDLVIGLTVVALGTSLPELAASIVAVIRGEKDIAVGNIVGSNIFNIGLVLGLAAVLTPDGLPVAEAAIAFDLPVLVAVSFALLPVVFTGLAIGRAEGALFVGYYLAYTGFVLLDASDHDALPRYSAVMATFVIPLTVVTLAVMVVYEITLRRGRRGPTEAEPETSAPDP